MNTITAKILLIGLSLLSTLITGVMLTHSGRPFDGLIFTTHKLSGLGTVILIAWSVYQLSKAVDIHTVSLIMIAVTALLFLALFVSGTLLSFDKPTAQAIFRIHQVAPWLALVSSTITIYLLVGSEALGRTGVVR